MVKRAIQYHVEASILFYGGSVMRPRFVPVFIALFSAAVLMLFLSCSALDAVMKDTVQKPRVSFRSAELTGLTFAEADLLFVLEIENPNSFGVHMAGFDYDFRIDEATFVSGVSEDRLEIDAGGSSMVELPVNVAYSDLFSSFSSLIDKDESTYQIACGFTFELPVLGRIRIPVSREGEIPVLRFPKICYGGLKVTNLTFTRAELELSMHLDNPNALSLNLSSLAYDLEINQSPWVEGGLHHTVEIGKHEEGVIRLPFTLNLIEIGMGAYDILREKKPVEYRVSGDYGFTTSVPLIGEVGSDFLVSGVTQIFQ
jgi:LEA14-like dessication related protein